MDQLKRVLGVIGLATLILANSACDTGLGTALRGARALGQLQERTVARVDVETASDRQPGAIRGRVTLRRSAFEGRDFLWGAALQWSTVGEGGQYLQAIALGNEIARIRTENGRLLVTAVQSHFYESDINRPERLLASHAVIDQTADTVTIAVEAASPVLATIMDGPNSPMPRSTWVRSIEHIQEGDYLLIETSVESSQGQVFEYMESLYPRDTLVRPTSSTDPSPAPFYLNSEVNPKAERYRFLEASSPIWIEHGGKRVASEVAAKFDISNGRTIDWYVTSNAPADMLPTIKTGVEGWNRYFRSMFGRDVVLFKGYLPKGVKLGDPRFNVINWDSVREAGSAYESQASDPLTGIQSHSLIYMPYAWYEIGLEFWRNGEFSETRELQSARLAKRLEGLKLAGRPLRTSCFHDIAEQASLNALQSPDAFGRELVKGVLLHEVGHALGLAHNFKGSLSLDEEAPASAFSTSIMDYNQFQIEDSAFTSVDSADGPLLEYDRQILSVLYNGGRDVAPTDPVVPACNDEEADARDEGVDPFCVRYDAGADPSVRLIRTQALIFDPTARLGDTLSLRDSLRTVMANLPDATQIKTRAELDQSISDLWRRLEGTLRFYIRSGAQSWSSMASLNADSLRIHRATDAAKSGPLRERIGQSVQALIDLKSLPSEVEAELVRFPTVLRAWAITTPAWVALNPTDQEAVDKALVERQSDWQTKKVPELLATARTRALSSLPFNESSPWAIDTTVDYETFVIGLLEGALNQPDRPQAERLAAATSLASHAPLSVGEAAIERSKALLEAEVAQSSDATKRRDLRRLLKALTESP